MAISLSTVKAALRIDYTADDAELTRLIAAAVSWVEYYCGFALTSATRTMYLTDWKDTAYAVQPWTNTISIVYNKPDGTGSTLGASDYYNDRSGPLTILRFKEAVPDKQSESLVVVSYTGGYSTEPNEVVQAVISLVGSWYNNPEANAPTQLSAVPLGAQFMLEHIRLKAPFS
jgi:uncharacterized phiE125 gp8 family phage protein